MNRARLELDPTISNQSHRPRESGSQGATSRRSSWVPAFQVVRKVRSHLTRTLFPSFPRKREPRDFSHLPWVPAFAGTTIFERAAGFLFRLVRGNDCSVRSDRVC